MKTRSSKNASDVPALPPSAPKAKVAKNKGLKRAHSPEKTVDAVEKPAKKTRKTAEVEPEIAVAPAPAPVIPKYEGNFDFYFDDASGTEFAKRYEFLRQKQITGKPHGLCYFGEAPDYADSSFESGAFIHPMEESPYGLSLHSITANASSGISAKVGLLESDCGIASLDGHFKMKRVWVKPGDASIELFEGEVRVKIGHGSMYSSRGFGRGTNKELTFTAIRKKNAAGEEVGLGPRKCQAGSLSHGSGGGYGGSFGGSLYGGLDDSDDDIFGEKSDDEDSDGNVKGSLRWHYKRHKDGIYNY